MHKQEKSSALRNQGSILELAIHRLANLPQLRLARGRSWQRSWKSPSAMTPQVGNILLDQPFAEHFPEFKGFKVLSGVRTL